jgi:DNA-binding transcriptional MocR family regulator
LFCYNNDNVMQQTYINGDNAVKIAGSVEFAVHRGRLKPGDPLPTVRDLASTLRVSPTTVAAAYKLLQSRGLVSGLGRKGTRITSRPPSPAVTSRPRVPEGAFDLATGNPDPALLPSLEQALRSIDSAPRLYDGPTLLPALATFVAGEFEADGIAAKALTVTGGGLDAIERVLREHLRAGDHVGVEDPSFPGVLDLIAGNGFVPVPFEVDDEGPVPDAFAAGCRGRVRAAVITPRAQNPTGAALTEARARELRRILKRLPDLLVIEDDHAGPIAGTRAVTVTDPSRAQWVVVRSVSKFLGPDLRTAFVAGDAMTVARVEGRQSLGTRWVSHVLQQIVLSLWSDPSSGRRLARAADIYRQRREALLAALNARGIEGRGASGLNVWVPVREETAVVHGLLERGWAVTPGERFRLHSPPGIRVTTAALSAADADRFAADLAAVLQPPRAGSFV